MIKAVYTYKTFTADLGELFDKFAQSADPKFDSTPTNVKIEMSESAWKTMPLLCAWIFIIKALLILNNAAPLN